LDWSTTLLQRLGAFAQSLPCDICNTTVGHRLSVAREAMLAEVSNSSGPGSLGASEKMCQPDELPKTSNEHDELSHYRTQNLHLSDQVRAPEDEVSVLQACKELSIETIRGLEQQLKAAAAARVDYERELEEYRVNDAWSQRESALRELQARNQHVQTLLSEPRRVLFT